MVLQPAKHHEPAGAGIQGGADTTTGLRKDIPEKTVVQPCFNPEAGHLFLLPGQKSGRALYGIWK